MDNQIRNKLLIIATVGFMLSGILFLCLSIFTEPKNTTYLCIALANVTLGNLFNIIRAQGNKQQK